MEIRFRNYRRAITIVLMALVVLAIGKMTSEKEYYVDASYGDSAGADDGTFELQLWVNHSNYVKWWSDEQNDRYVLFVPGAMEGKKLNLTFPGVEYLFIDGEKVYSGEKYCFAEGEHTLKTGELSDSPAYDLNVMYTSRIASVFLETESQTLDAMHASKDSVESGKMLILDGKGRKYFEGDIEAVHCRGNSSFEETDKKSYTVKLAQKADLFGMGEAKKWILTANAFDDTLLRNTTAFTIARFLNLAYTPEAQYVDVYANGGFIGNYLLCEKIEIGKNRVDIRDLEEENEILNGDLDPDNLEFFMEPQGRLFSTKGYRLDKEPDDISGGYLLELETSDRYGLEASGFLTSRMQPVVFTSPKYASYGQVSYIARLYQDFEDAAFSEDGYSPYTGAAYSDYIDMDSFARKYLLEELVKNLDASYTSQYLYKFDDSVSDKFFAGPCWDYDKSIAVSFITDRGTDLHDPNGLYAAVQEKYSNLWYALYQHEDFREKVAEVFFQELEPLLREYTGDLLYSNKEQIRKSNDCNMIRWNTFPQTEGLDAKREQYDQKVDELIEFIQKRMDFLDREWGAAGVDWKRKTSEQNTKVCWYTPKMTACRGFKISGL